MIFLSIVIPVYNVKDYLIRCVDSVITECQGLEYEVLLVDDGSTDDSGILCDELARKSINISSYHKSNGGLSDARNYGTERAKGEYIFYLDSDDYLVNGGLKAEIDTAKSLDCDVVCGNFYYKYSDHELLFNQQQYDMITFKGGEDALRELILGVYYQNFAWGKLIRRDLAQKYLFPKGKLFEDTYWFYTILDAANKVSVINKPIVNYLQRENSISFSYKLNSLDILDGYLVFLHFLESKYPNLVDSQKALIAQNCIGQAWMICRFLHKDERRIAVRKVREVISACNLIDNKTIDKSLRKRLVLINKSMLLYKYTIMFDKLIKLIIR